VSSGVGGIDAARQHRNRGPTHGQRRPMRGTVDAVGRPGDDAPPLLGQIGGELGRDVVAVAGAGPGTDNCHRAPGDRGQVERAADP
jgi:hypothetical protein